MAKKVRQYLAFLGAVLMLVSLGSPIGVASGVAYASETDSSYGTLRDGNYVEWINRVNLPEYALQFYQTLEEQSQDSQGALADVTEGTKLKNGMTTTGYGLLIHSFRGTIPSGTTQEEFSTAVQNAFETVAEYATIAYHAFDRDHPEVFWLGRKSKCSVSASTQYDIRSGTYKYEVRCYFVLQDQTGFDVRADEYSSVDEIEVGISERESAIGTILTQTDDTTRYDIIKKLNHWLTYNNGYNSYVSAGQSDQASMRAWSCLSALTGSRDTEGPTCEGYSRAFKVIGDRLSIPCVLVDGQGVSGSRSEAHMWNYVQMNDGQWYGMDVTWNDPIVNNQDTEGNEKYLLVGGDTVIGSSTFLSSHKVENIVSDNGISFLNGPVLSGESFDLAHKLDEPQDDVEQLQTAQETQQNLSELSFEPVEQTAETDSSDSQGDQQGQTIVMEKGEDTDTTVVSVIPAAADSTATQTTVTQSSDQETLPSTYRDSAGSVYTIKVAGSKVTVSYKKPKNKKVTSVTIPAVITIKGVRYPVQSVTSNAFKNCKKLKKVTVGKNVNKIGKQAFLGCQNLKTMKIKTTKLTTSSVGSKAFKNTGTKLVVSVPKKKKSAYKKIFIKRGLNKKATVK